MQDVAESPGRRFATLIRDARRRLRLTQEEVIERSGVSRSTLLRWEKGDVERPDLGQVRALVLMLDEDPREAVIALGLVTREEMGLPAERVQLHPVVEDVQRLLNDERIPKRQRDNLLRGVTSARDVWLDMARIRAPKEPAANERTSTNQ